MRDTRELIDTFVNKNDSVYVPPGRVTWRLPTGIFTLDKILGGGLPGGSIIQIYGPEKSGKALSVDTPIPTPIGWTTMGEVKVGDIIFDGDGRPTTVTFVTPVMCGHKCYKMTFSGGASLVADAEHLWEIRSHSSPVGRLCGRFGNRQKDADSFCEFGKSYIVSTEEISRNIIARTYRSGGVLYNYRINLPHRLELEDVDLPIPPYTLGVWLGDGTSECACITVGYGKESILDRIREENVPIKKRKIATNKTPMYSLSTGGRSQAERSKSIQAMMHKIGLLNNKHIPQQYLRSSSKQRLELLRGLVDTDGCISKKSGRCEIAVTNERLAKDIYELARSLGYVASMRVGQAKLYGHVVSNNYRVAFTPFDMVATVPQKSIRILENSPKILKKKPRTVSICGAEEVESVPVRCIQVDAPNHMYLAGSGMIPTHNTTVAYHIAAKAIEAGYSTLLIPLEKYSEQYAEACGVDVRSENLHLVSADYAELVFNLCIEAIRNYDAKVIVMDSISAAVPKSDLEKKQKTEDMDKGYNIGSQSRAVSDFIRKVQQPIRRKEAIFVTVNQLSYEIGKWGGRKVPKGGMALQYFSDIKLSMWGTENRPQQSIESRITVDKGKDWDIIPYGMANLVIRHAKGVDAEFDLITVCERAGIVSKKGAWYNYGDYKAQGVDKFTALLREKPELRAELFEKATNANIEIEKEIDEEELSEES